MAIKDDIDRLGDLYRVTGDDWVLMVHHILTEPTCPTVIIRREGSNALRYRYDRDTIEDGIRAASEAVYREVVLGQTVESESPITNSDDHPDDPKWHPTEPDIVERLHAHPRNDDPTLIRLHHDAVYEIGKLRSENEELKIRLSKNKRG